MSDVVSTGIVMGSAVQCSLNLLCLSYLPCVKIQQLATDTEMAMRMGTLDPPQSIIASSKRVLGTIPPPLPSLSPSHSSLSLIPSPFLFLPLPPSPFILGQIIFPLSPSLLSFLSFLSSSFPFPFPLSSFLSPLLPFLPPSPSLSLSLPQLFFSSLLLSIFTSPFPFFRPPLLHYFVYLVIYSVLFCVAASAW